MLLQLVDSPSILAVFFSRAAKYPLQLASHLKILKIPSQPSQLAVQPPTHLAKWQASLPDVAPDDCPAVHPAALPLSQPPMQPPNHPSMQPPTQPRIQASRYPINQPWSQPASISHASCLELPMQGGDVHVYVHVHVHIHTCTSLQSPGNFSGLPCKAPATFQVSNAMPHHLLGCASQPSQCMAHQYFRTPIQGL